MYVIEWVVILLEGLEFDISLVISLLSVVISINEFFLSVNDYDIFDFEIIE